MREQQGFTLVEILVVTCIIAILAAIGYSAYAEHVIKAEVTEGMVTRWAQLDQGERAEELHWRVPRSI